MIGTGAQAWSQLGALAAVRPLVHAGVYSPTPRHREDFAAQARTERGLAAAAAADAAAGTHVITVGPKLTSAHETPLPLVAAAAVVTCDSPAQAAACPEPFFTGSTPLTSLADVLLGHLSGRRHRDDITVHCSVGLPGSEVLIAHHLAARARA